ncbi:DEAD/DEAH box helicase [Methylocaldum sp.]|uniref:DEAD/DEAH box helicase n=1 Tax=Methylocaldum sp. TaxID=1969727 RepID=UPI002D4EBAE2|nr:DEAD/DEAH box helicase [Methylocaldum sp.]HYE36947.1 DEAD/DEAH box helicase [Methylocaldum sp.]
MAKVELSCEVQPQGFEFRLLRHRLLGAAQAFAVSEWPEAASDSLLPGVSQLLAWLDDEASASIVGDVVIVHHHVIAALDIGTARAISAPPTPPFILDLQHVGTIDRPEFRFKITWLQTNGQPVPGLRREGAALKVGSRFFRIPEPFYGIVETADAFNATPPDDMDGRFRAWAKMRGLLPEESGNSIQVDGYLGSTRVAHAASFSLALHSGADGFTFDPVLFGPDLTSAVADGLEEMPHEVESLLPPAQQELFARKRFLESMECRARYTLGAGWYVVLDEPVRKALGVVRQVQRAHQNVRKEFVRNPRSYIAKALSDEFPDDVLEAIFLETAEFSDRVRDVGIWQTKVLPWVKKNKETWLPEAFGIRVGGQTVKLEPGQVPDLQTAVESAITDGKPSVNWNGIDIPATSDTLSTLISLMGEIKPSPESSPVTEYEQEAVDFDHGSIGDGGQYVLEIDDNLSEVGYHRVRISRPTAPAKAIPTRLKTALKTHQTEGLAWLQDAWISGHPGVLLADDMGLGKTLQALAFLAWLREGMDLGHPKPAPILIVAPTGLLKNWEQEHNQHLHLPGLGDVLRAFGSGLVDIRSRGGREIQIGQATLDSTRLSKANWILTTYETLRDYQHSFCAIRYAAVVFDEMQKIKMPGTVMTHAAKALNADFIVGLTGTPIENRLADLWCLMDTIQPGLLNDLATFSRIYEKEEKPDDLRQLKAILTEPSPSAPQIMMRRMKADRLKGLPEKIEHPLEQLMSPIQAQAYNEAVRAARTGGGGSKILEALHRLRSISLHPIHPSSAADDGYVELSARFKLALGILDGIAAKGEKALGRVLN